MDSSECAGAGTLLGLRCAATVAALRAGQDAAGRDDEYVAVREFLLQFACKAERMLVVWSERLRHVKGKLYRCCERCHPVKSGTGTKMTIAFLPWPTSICNKNPGVSAYGCPVPIASSSYADVGKFDASCDV